MQRVLIIGTGLIGASVGLALRAAGFAGTITGWDRNPAQTSAALPLGAIDHAVDDPLEAARAAEVVVLATPVLAILEWMLRLVPALREGQLVTDVGSTKQQICACAAAGHYNEPGRAAFLPGHPMAGKETAGAAAAEAGLFRGAMWLFTSPGAPAPLAADWRAWVAKFGARSLDLEPERHDELVAWASHLPQFLATALTAALEDEFGASEDLRAVGGRALREMTRLGASPFSMWRDIAETNTKPIAQTLLALEKRLASVRKELAKPSLREEFDRANRFRSRF
ncbi:MAG: prephenate dehydrogenase [Terriglobales bacterium]